MRTLFQKYWDSLWSSFWFLPSFMVLGAALLAWITIAIDERMPDNQVIDWSWIYTGSPEGAAALLGTISGSMINLAGVVFSLTLVALTLASSQFGPRLLRNFMRDTTNQVVLGTFVATFLYSLLVLRTIRRDTPSAFVPHLSVSIAVLFSMVSLGVLIFFIHHVAVSIQADEVISRVVTDLMYGIDNLFPEHIGKEGPTASEEFVESILPECFEEQASPIHAHGDGYLQLIDADSLIAMATREDLLLHVERRPGHYVQRGSVIVKVSPREKVTDAIETEINSAFVLGRQRTPTQDIEFAVTQLVEVAVRALSPGVNDPFTAVTCVDRLGSALCRLAQREMPSPYRRDKEKVRIVAQPISFAAIVNAGFNQIRQYARSDAAVTIRLEETIAVIAAMVNRREDGEALLRQAAMIVRGAQEGLPEAEDRQEVQERYERVRAVLRKKGLEAG